MFKELNEKYLKDNDKYSYFKEAHEIIVNFKDISHLIDKSKIIKTINIDKHGMYLQLNEKAENLKLYIDNKDFKQVPMSIICNGNYEEEETEMVLKIIEAFGKTNLTFFDITTLFNF